MRRFNKGVKTMTAKEVFELLNSTMQNEAEDYVFDNIIKPAVIARLDKEFEDYDWEADYCDEDHPHLPEYRDDSVDVFVLNCMENEYTMVDEPILVRDANGDFKRIGTKSHPVHTDREKIDSASQLLYYLDLDSDVYEGFELRIYALIEQWLSDNYKVYGK